MTTGNERLKGWLRRGDDCIGHEDLAAWRDGSADPETAARIAAHLGDCAHCATELSLMRAFDAAPDESEANAVAWIAARLRERSPAARGAAPEPAVGAETAPTGPWWRPEWLGTPAAMRWAAVAAGLLALAIALPILLDRSRELPLPAPDRTPAVLRSGSVEIREPEGDLPGPPLQLDWEPVEGAERYEVFILEVDRTEFWRSDAPSAPFPVPPDVRGRIAPGRTLLWQVRAFDAAGREIARSGTVRFRAGPASRQ